MRAVVADGDRLVWGEAPIPEVGPGDVRIRVVAAACNRADLLQRAGAYPPPPGASPILGLECSGFVEEVGGAVTAHSPGDPVCALLAGGGFAEQVVCPAVQAVAPPRTVGLVEAATLPEVWATAWSNLVEIGGMAAGDRVVIHAGASGVGLAALQLARLRGARAFALAGDDDRQAACLRHGAEATADRHGAWAEAVRAWCPEGVSLVLDPVGGGALSDNVSLLRAGGILVVIGLLGGRTGTLDLGRVLVKRLRIVGSTLRSRPPAEKGAILASLARDVWPAFEAGTLAPTVDRVLPITEFEAAFDALASNSVVGKIALTVG
jgi:putative PIG3 family NAD(P)H quinone oxidoreductase